MLARKADARGGKEGGDRRGRQTNARSRSIPATSRRPPIADTWGKISERFGKVDIVVAMPASATPNRSIR